jgi:hypothetical protein
MMDWAPEIQRSEPEQEGAGCCGERAASPGSSLFDPIAD